MSGWKAIGLGSKTNAKVLAVMMVAILTVSGALVLLSSSEATMQYKTGGSITYDLGGEVYMVDAHGNVSADPTPNYSYNIKPDGTRQSLGTSSHTTVKLNTYYGVKATEYNPEFWTGWGEVYLYSGDGTYGQNGTGMWNVAGPMGTATWDNLTITAKRTGTVGDLTVNLPAGCKIHGSNPAVTTFTISNGQSSATVTIDYSVSVHKVFGGWSYPGQPNSMVYPGDVVAWNVEALDAKWILPDLYAKTYNLENISVTDNHDGTGSISIPVTPYTFWASSNETTPRASYVYNYSEKTAKQINEIVSPATGETYTVIYDENEVGKQSDLTGGLHVIAGDVVRFDGTDWVWDHDGMFSSIYYMDGNKTYYLSGTVSLITGTYRTQNPYGLYDVDTRNGRIDYKATISTNTTSDLHGNVVVDNITFDSNTPTTHGASYDGAIVAGAHRLILGTNISTLHFEKSTAAQQQEDKLRRAPNILGGRTSDDVIEKEKVAILNDGENTAITVAIGSFIIIHSGIYTSVATGPSKDAEMGKSTPISTYAVLKDCMVADTIGGASSNGKVNGHLPTGSGYKDGGTFIYLVGAFTMGDYWQDNESGYSDFITGNGPAGNINGNTRAYTYNWQSSVAHGGSLSGTVTGSSHLIIAGDSSVWDCMGAGRDKGTITGYSYLEITGRAEVRRVACGLTTDGSSATKNNVTNGLTIRISDDALVASVYGGGFDTWSYPSGNTMLSGEINVDISGGTIGDVYGGGYRGTIGTSSDTSKLRINISISGDTVIEGNVYGGGSGGLNKMKHIAYDQKNIKVGDYSNMDVVAGQGFQNGSGIDGNTKTTGKSYVYGTITVDISGGTVKGDVYGGGMSVPKLLYYSNIIKFNDDPSKPSPFVGETEDNTTTGKPVETATVVGDVTVKIRGDAVVNGSVYGAGKGIKLTSDGYVDKSEYGFNKVVYRSGDTRTIDRMYWVDGGENSSNRTYDDSAALNYQNYAQVKGNVTVIIENEPWYHDQDPVIGSSYTVDASDAQNKFIVLHRGTGLPSGYNVVKVGSDGTVTMVANLPAGDNEHVTGVNGWKVGNTTINTDAYTVNASDADDSRTIVVYHPSYDRSRYTVLMIDGEDISSIVRAEGASIALETSRVDGSVYGGGGFGRLVGSSMVSVDSGIVGTNVFGGGLGVAGRVAVEGNRVVYIQNESSITGSVYGGSEVGIDGKVIKESDLDSKDPSVVNRVQQQLHANRSGIIIQGGFVQGSVFGGGLMGKTYGNTAIYIGYYLPSLSVRTPTPVNFSGSTGIQLSVGSVFAGGNISSSGEDDSTIVGAYTDFLVMGSGYVSIYGSENKSVDIPGSIMGSGNACKTRGDTDIELVNMYGTSSIAGIHRATTVTIDRSNIAIAGRSTVTEIFNQIKVASIFDVEELVLKGSSSINFGTPMDDIKTLKSLTSDGTPTTDKSPQNRLVYRDGPTLYVRYADANGNPAYGNVEGFALMVSTQGDYGAYAMASTASTGGFSVNKSGTSAEADTSVSGNICCWYVSGISKKISTMYLQLDNDSRDLEWNETYITINKFQADTSIMFTGGVFTKMSNDPNGDPYTFVRPGSESMEDEPAQLSLALAYPKNDGQDTVKLYDPTSRLMSIANGAVTNQPGTFFKKDGIESDIDGVNRNRSLVSVPMSYSNGASSAAGPMNIYLCLTGRPIDSTAYVGYVTLTFQEIKQVNYESVGPDGTIINTPRYLVANTIELRVDIYIYGSPTSESSDTFSVEIKTNVDSEGYRDGSASTLIPQTYSMAELNLARVDIVGAGSGSMGDAAVADGVLYKIPDNGYYAPTGKTFDKWKLTSGNDTASAHPDQYLYITGSGTNAYIIDGEASVSKVNDITAPKANLTYRMTDGGTLTKGSLTVVAGAIVRFNEGSWSEVASPDLVITEKSMAIKPVWKDILNVVFDRNEGTGAIPTIHIGRGAEYVLPESDGFVAPSGQKFAYWSVTIGDDRAVSRVPGETITVEGDVVVKAVWAPKVTVSFDKGSHGSGTMGSVLAPSGQRYTLPMSDFTPDSNYEFSNWSIVIKNSSGTTISSVSTKYPGDTVKLPSDASTAVLTAQWIDRPSMSSVAIVGNGAVPKIDKNLIAGGTVDCVDGWYVKGVLANKAYTLAAGTSSYAKDVKLDDATVYHIDSYNRVYNASHVLVSEVFYTDPECMDAYSVGTDIGATTVYTKGYTVKAGDADTNNFIVLYQTPNDNQKYTVIIVPSSGSPSIDRNHAVGTTVYLPAGTWVDKTGDRHSTGSYTVDAADADSDSTRFIILYESTYDKSKITALHVVKVTYTVADGTKFRLPDCPFDGPGGRSFAGWSVSIGGGSPYTYQPGAILSITGGANVSAVWKTTQTIGFARGEESKGQGSMDDQYVPYEGQYTIPSPDGISPKSGYEFYRWNCEGSYYYPGQSIKVTGNMLLTAEWIDIPSPTQMVVFDPNGESGYMHMMVEDTGSEYVLPNCEYTSSDRVFRGWSVTVGDGGAVEMFPGETVVVNGDVYARAIWAARFGSAPIMKMIIFVEEDQASATIQRSVRVGSTINFSGTYNAMVTGAHVGSYTVSAADADEYGFIVLYRTAVADNMYTVLAIEDRVTVAKNKAPGDHVNLSAINDPLFCKNVPVHTDANKDYKVDASNAISSTYRYIILSAGNQVDISFDGNGASGSMREHSILRGASRYVLPDCGFAAPAGKVFSMWEITCGNGVAYGYPGESIYQVQRGVNAYILDGYATAAEIDGMAKSDDLKYYVTVGGTITGMGTVDAGTIVQCDGSSWAVATADIMLTSSEVTLTPVWKDYSNEVRVDYDSGVTIYGTVGVTAEPNQDNTSGWSNLGKTVTWDLHEMALSSDSAYVGTLLGSIVGNVSFSVSGLMATDSGGEVFLPSVDLVFNRAGVEAHTTLVFADIREYSVIFIDHGFETVNYYPENTLLTRDLCESPSGNNFNGWYLDSGFVNRYDYNMVVNDESDGMKLYARYTYVVTLDCMNGVKYTLQISEEDSGALLTESDLPVPEYTGYTFAGWCKDSARIYDWSYQSDRIYEDTTLYARWIGMEVRIYFWYEKNGELLLFDGDAVGQSAVKGKYNLQQAYMLDKERALYPTVTWGDTFDVKDPYSGESILAYAERIIDFGASFVKWSVVSPTDSSKHIGIYSDTVVGSKVLKFVTDSMMEGCEDLWEYYLLHDGGYPRVDWDGDGRPDTMEIHLKAETTKIAIRVDMGLSEEDEKYSPTVTIDDPESFLVYPNGPDLNNPNPEFVGSFYDEYGQLYYAGIGTDPHLYWKSKMVLYHYDSYGVLRHNTSDVLPSFYWNEDGSIRYIYDKAEGCWTCLDESDAEGTDSTLDDNPYIKYVTFPKNSIQQYRAVNRDDPYGNTVDASKNLKSVAYAVVNEVEKKFLVEWDATSDDYYLIYNTNKIKLKDGDVALYTIDGNKIKYTEDGNPSKAGQEIEFKFYVDAKRSTVYIPGTTTPTDNKIYADTFVVRKYYDHVEAYDAEVITGDYVRKISSGGQTLYYMKADDTIYYKDQNNKYHSAYSGVKFYTDSVVKTEETLFKHDSPAGPVYLADIPEYQEFVNLHQGNGGLNFYLKDTGGKKFSVESVSKSVGSFACTVYLQPWSGSYHEFIFKLNNAVRSGYTLHGWHNEYISWENAMTPSADQIRKIHLTHDGDGNVTYAKLISEDSYGNVVEIPLLVGDYVVDPKDADASGTIAVVPNDNQHVKPTDSTVTKIIENRNSGDTITLDTLSGGGKWYVNKTECTDQSTYTVSAVDADIEGTIIVTDTSSYASAPYLVTLVDTEGSRTFLGKYAAGSKISFDEGSWKSKNQATIDSSHDYTVASADADALGNIVIVYSSYTISSYTVKVIKHGCAEGSTVILNDISDNPTRGFAGWIVDGRELDGDDYTVDADDADHGFIVLFSTLNEANKYTVIVVGDSSVSVWRNQDAGALIDLDRSVWYNSKTGTSVDKTNNQYAVNASHADSNRFIVLYKTANKANEYTVIEADGSSVKATAGMSVGDLVDGVGGWHVRSRAIDNSTYTIRSYDADVNGSIVLGTMWTDMSKYNVVWNDGNWQHTDSNVQVGTAISAPHRESEQKTFLGWRAATGTIDNTYIVSHADRTNSTTITLTAIWSDDTPAGYSVVMVSEKGGMNAQSQSHVAGDEIDLKDRMKSSGYKHVGWRIITGSNPRLITAPYYKVDISDADNRNTVILMAEWAKTYTVTIDGDPVHDQVSGDAVNLDYPNDNYTWKVRYDIISKGGEVDNAANTFTMKYDAVWTQIPYSVHLVQPANGTIEVYMEDREGSSTSRLLTDEEVNSMVFYHGDKLRISYTPNNSKVSFIKWIVTNTSLIESATSSSTMLVIQDDCSITVDESTGRMMDIMIAFDDDNLDARDRAYTRVFMRDPSSGDYYEATYIPGLVKMDHYMVKVPYGDGYEVVLWYGWGPGPADSCEKLEGFANAPDEYVLVGTVNVTISDTGTVIYDVISAGFIDTINSPNKIATIVDTEYGTIKREYATDPKFDFLFTSDEYVTTDPADPSNYARDVKKNGETVYRIKDDNSVYDAEGNPSEVRFFTSSDCLESSLYTANQGNKTVYTPIIRGSNGGNIVVYDQANAANTYTVIKVTSGGSVSAESCKAVGDEITGVNGWQLKGRTINGSYSVKAKDADAGGFIVIYQAETSVNVFNVVKADWNSTSYAVTIDTGKESNYSVTLGDGTWHVRGRTISDEDTETAGTQYRVNPMDAYPGTSESALDRTLSYVAGSGAGHPIMIKDSEGNIVAKVTKYVGIQRDMLARLAANNLNINNPDGGTPPVVITFDPNYTYSTYEGFPWKDVTSRNVFALESDINLATVADSNKAPQKTFYLNWVRTDSPADIIMQISPSTVPDHYATGDVRIIQEDDEYRSLFSGIRYDLGTAESDADAKGFIVIFQTPNVTERYTVVMVGTTTTTEMNLALDGTVTTTEALYDVNGVSHAAGTYVIGNLTSLADENRFIVLYKTPNASDHYTAVKVFKNGSAESQSELVAGNPVTGVDGWHLNDRTLHGNYVVDTVPYYHIDSPLDVIAGYEPVPEIYNGGNIVLYLNAVASGYKVITVTSEGNVAISDVKLKDEIFTTGVAGTWYVKGRTADSAPLTEGTQYKVDPSDADAGGYIVLYQSPTADGKFNVVKVAASSISIEKNLADGGIATGTFDGWHVKGRAIADADPSTLGTQYKVDRGDAYTAGMGDGGECRVIHGNELHLKLPTSCGNNVKVLVTYERDSVWYVLNDSTYGYEGTVRYDGGVTLEGSGVWGETLELPTTFKNNGAGDDIQINLWVVGRPDGTNGTVEKKDGVFVYEFTKAGAISTSDFIYTVQGTSAEGYVKQVLQNGSVLYYINSSSEVFDAETGDPLATKFYTNRTCTTQYTVDLGATTIYTDTRVIFTPLTEQNFITLTFSTYYGAFDYSGGQRLSVSLPAGGTMVEYARTMAELQSVARFIGTYSTGEWEYTLDGFFWGKEELDIDDDDDKIMSDRTYIASWTPNESYKKMFSYTNGGHSDISALRDAVAAEAIGAGELKRFVVDTEITISIQPESGYVIDLDRTRGELGYMLVGTEIYVDITTAGEPTGSAHTFSSWRLWDQGAPTRAGYQVTEMTDDAKEGFLVYIANWSGTSTHAGSIGLIFVTDASMAANAVYADAGDTKTLPSGNWKIWNKGNNVSGSYVVNAEAAIDGYILFVKENMTLNEYNAVFATEYGTVSAAVPLDHYYKDTTGNKYHKTNPDRAYRYEVVSLNPTTYDWVEYTVTNLAGHDGLFIMQFSTEQVSYKATREGQFYRATPETYTVTAVDGSNHIAGFRNDSSGATYTVTGGIIKDSQNHTVNMKLFSDKKLTNRIVDLTTYTSAVNNKMYTGNFVECDPVQGFYGAKLDDTARTYYTTTACDVEASSTAALSYSKPVDVVETYMYRASHHYVLKPFGSEYECFETSILQYEITPYGSQFRDIFGTVWNKNGNGGLSVVSAVVWEIDPLTNKETSTTITNLATELPNQYYLKDSYGNYYKGNYFDTKALTISRITLKVDGKADANLWVKYINDNEYVKGLYTTEVITGEPNYLLKRNGQLVTNNAQKTPVDGTLYYYGTTVPYFGDYTIVTTVSKYSTDTEVRINGVTYHRDGFGNLYYDWLGSPTELSGNRGYSWTFLLKDSIDITFYMKEVSYNINFVVNGNKVKATDMNAISTVTTLNSGISNSGNVAANAKVDLDSGTWYSYNSGSPVSKTNNQYTVDPVRDAINKFILLYKTANTGGTYTVVKVDGENGKNTTMYRSLKAGDKVQLDGDTWYNAHTGLAVSKDGDKKYAVMSGDHADNNFIVLYKAEPTNYNVLKVDDAAEYHGTSIRQYTIVSFDGPSSNRAMKWYTDPDYKNEYTGFGENHILTPDKFEVDITMSTALTADGKTFSKWTMFGTGTYSPVQSLKLTGGSQHLAGDVTATGVAKNYFYIVEAAWTTHGSGTYKIVYASPYNNLTENMVYANLNASITLMEIDDEEFRGWKVWNTGSVLADANDGVDGVQYTVKDADSVEVDGSKYILMVADFGEDLTYANNVVYASEYGTVPKMESIRKYQYNATRDITLYGHTGTYVVFLHDFDGTYEPKKYELLPDENYRITIPQDHYTYGDYVFVGWSAYNVDGKRAYTYAPEESINISALSERVNLYPYYLSDGSDVKYYDGLTSTLKLGMDDVLRKVQCEPNATVLKVSYSDSPIEEYDPQHAGAPKSGVHAGDYYVYYAAEIMTPLGTGDATHGNTLESHTFYGKATLKILKVDAYAIAPSAYIRQGDGDIIVASDPANLQPGDMSGGNIVFTSYDITLIGLVPADVASKSLYANGQNRVVVHAPADTMIIKPQITFTLAEKDYVSIDYNLKYIDGSLTVYPIDASKYEGEGNI